jgi:hypothetical protein
VAEFGSEFVGFGRSVGSLVSAGESVDEASTGAVMMVAVVAVRADSDYLKTLQYKLITYLIS